jgi:membrane-associated phospholipid phosphatase
MTARTGTGFALSSPAAWLVPLLVLIGFVVLVASDANQRVFFALNAIGPATSSALWASITVLGDTAVALALCLPLWRRRPDLIWALAVGGLLAAAWVHGLKPLLEVPRPPVVLGDAVYVIGPVYTVHSFPSGHATTSTFVAGLMALGLGSRLGYAAALAVAVAAAASRSVVGAHWPLDLLGGAFGGWLAAMAGLALARRFPAPGRIAWIQWALGLLLAGSAAALVAGYDGSYPQASWFVRGIGVAALAAAATAVWQDRRGWR